MEPRQGPSPDREGKLLAEINKLADRVRELRRANASRNEAQIKAMTAQLRSKWEEMRALRAPAAVRDTTSHGRGGLYS